MLRRAPFLTAFLMALALVAPAAASAAATAATDDDGPIVVLDGDVEVAAGESVGGVFIANGDARIDGHVDGEVMVFNGDVLLSGSVSGNLVTFSGHARLLRSARVGGDVRYSDQRPTVSPLARVGGDVTDEGWEQTTDLLPFLGGFVVWIAVSISFLILGALLLLVAPRTADALFERSRERIGPTLAIGVAIAISLPVAALLAAVLVVGIPLAIGILMAIAPLGAIAYTVSAYVVGRRLIGPPRHRILALIAGVALLRAVALVPVLGLLVGLAAVVLGFGLIGAAIGAARAPEASSEAGTPGS